MPVRVPNFPPRARQLRLSATASTKWDGRYNEHGPECLGDRRLNNGTVPAILTPEALSSLKERLKTPPG
ncbi:MAG: hypothetical protein WBX25_02050, partial [Rhodomicrobium sp.]